MEHSHAQPAQTCYHMFMSTSHLADDNPYELTSDDLADADDYRDWMEHTYPEDCTASVEDEDALVQLQWDRDRVEVARILKGCGW